MRYHGRSSRRQRYPAATGLSSYSRGTRYIDSSVRIPGCQCRPAKPYPQMDQTKQHSQARITGMLPGSLVSDDTERWLSSLMPSRNGPSFSILRFDVTSNHWSLPSRSTSNDIQIITRYHYLPAVMQVWSSLYPGPSASSCTPSVKSEEPGSSAFSSAMSHHC